MNVEHGYNINNITCDDLYQSPIKNKDVSTINDSVYNQSDEHIDTIIDSIKHGDARNNPIKETHIFDRIITLSIGVGSLEPAVIRIIIQGSTPLRMNLVAHVLINSSKQLYMTILSPLNTFQSKAFVVGSQDESVGGNSNIIFSSCDSRNSMGNHNRIGTQGVNKNICLFHKGFCTVSFRAKENNAVTLPHSAQRKHAFLGKIMEIWNIGVCINNYKVVRKSCITCQTFWCC